MDSDEGGGDSKGKPTTRNVAAGVDDRGREFCKCGLQYRSKWSLIISAIALFFSSPMPSFLGEAGCRSVLAVSNVHFSVNGSCRPLISLSISVITLSIPRSPIEEVRGFGGVSRSGSSLLSSSRWFAYAWESKLFLIENSNVWTPELWPFRRRSRTLYTSRGVIHIGSKVFTCEKDFGFTSNFLRSAAVSSKSQRTATFCWTTDQLAAKSAHFHGK